MKEHILIIDDEKDIQDIVKINLEKEGCRVSACSGVSEARKVLKSGNPDLVILDIMMPGTDGYEFIKELRASEKTSRLPVIFLSAKSDESDKVLGLELGGDDYIAKPFSVKELRSRVKAVLRRSSREKDQPVSEKELTHRGICLNPGGFSLSIDGKDVPVTKTEFFLLMLFMKNPGKIFTRDNIITSVKGADVYVIDRTIDVHIMNLRKKLGKYKNVIKTFSGVGYGFKDSAKE